MHINCSTVQAAVAIATLLQVLKLSHSASCRTLCRFAARTRPSFTFVWKYSARDTFLQKRCPGASRLYSTRHEKTPSPIQECWEATMVLINPDKCPHVDLVVQSLNSPAPQSYHVLLRALERSCTSLIETLQNCSYLLKKGRVFTVRGDSNIQSGKAVLGKDWSVALAQEIPREWIAINKQVSTKIQVPILSTAQLANEMLEVVIDAADCQSPTNEVLLLRYQERIKQRLDFTLGTDVRGRTAVDTAFTLALCGVSVESIFDSLVEVSYLELERVGRRPSRKPKEILHIIEKLAAAGVRGERVNQVYRLAAECLKLKKQFLDVAEVLENTPESFNLLSTRPLLWLWRYSARLNKPRPDDKTKSVKHHDIKFQNLFADTSRPLVVDLGCGLGVSLIGMAMSSTADNRVLCLGESYDWSTCNYLGGDLNFATLQFARGISNRWNLDDKLLFLNASAEELIQNLSNYEGPIAMIMIQFPTPFRLPNSEDGNQQLPSRSEFMASKSLIYDVANTLKMKEGGRLLLQSNCEDVAVYMQSTALQAGLELIPVPHPVDPESLNKQKRTQRTENWIMMGGQRAAGPGWSCEPLLPRHCQTETEIACTLESTTIHRCILEARV